MQYGFTEQDLWRKTPRQVAIWLDVAKRVVEKSRFVRDIRVVNLGFAGEQKHIDKALLDFDGP